jgi:hypothetical protein
MGQRRVYLASVSIAGSLINLKISVFVEYGQEDEGFILDYIYR